MKKDTKVNIVVADHPVNTTVPNIVGGTSAEAKALLEDRVDGRENCFPT